MKFVLVIDVADDVAEAYEDFTVDYDFRGTPKEDRTVNESIKYVEDAEPRPLPEKDEEPEDDLTDYVQQDYDRMASYFYGLINGRNDVINEILGETE